MTNQQDRFDEAAYDQGPIATADLKLAQWAARYEDNPFVEAAGTFGKLADQPPLIAASIAVCLSGFVVRDRRLTRAGLRMLGSHLLATGIKTLVKNNVDRPRPEKAAQDGEHHCEPGHSDDGEERSFPSGHTAGAVAVARAVVREYPRAATPAYAATTIAAGAQVPRKAHFPSDLVVGALIGFASEAIVALGMQFVRTRI